MGGEMLMYRSGTNVPDDPSSLPTLFTTLQEARVDVVTGDFNAWHPTWATSSSPSADTVSRGTTLHNLLLNTDWSLHTTAVPTYYPTFRFHMPFSHSVLPRRYLPRSSLRPVTTFRFGSRFRCVTFTLTGCSPAALAFEWLRQMCPFLSQASASPQQLFTTLHTCLQQGLHLLPRVGRRLTVPPPPLPPRVMALRAIADTSPHERRPTLVCDLRAFRDALEEHLLTALRTRFDRHCAAPVRDSHWSRTFWQSLHLTLPSPPPALRLPGGTIMNPRAQLRQNEVVRKGPRWVPSVKGTATEEGDDDGCVKKADSIIASIPARVGGGAHPLVAVKKLSHTGISSGGIAASSTSSLENAWESPQRVSSSLPELRSFNTLQFQRTPPPDYDLYTDGSVKPLEASSSAYILVDRHVLAPSLIMAQGSTSLGQMACSYSAERLALLTAASDTTLQPSRYHPTNRGGWRTDSPSHLSDSDYGQHFPVSLAHCSHMADDSVASTSVDHRSMSPSPWLAQPAPGTMSVVLPASLFSSHKCFRPTPNMSYGSFVFSTKVLTAQDGPSGAWPHYGSVPDGSRPSCRCCLHASGVSLL
eukprot:gene9565-6720_t